MNCRVTRCRGNPLGDAHQFDLLYEGVPPLKHHEEELVCDVGPPVVVLDHPRLDGRENSLVINPEHTLGWVVVWMITRFPECTKLLHSISICK